MLFDNKCVYAISVLTESILKRRFNIIWSPNDTFLKSDKNEKNKKKNLILRIKKFFCYFPLYMHHLNRIKSLWLYKIRWSCSPANFSFFLSPYITQLKYVRFFSFVPYCCSAVSEWNLGIFYLKKYCTKLTSSETNNYSASSSLSVQSKVNMF